MKVLHYSDKGVDARKLIELYSQCDVLVTTGDLTLFEVQAIENASIRKPVFGVYGNHDSGQYLETLGIKNLHNKVVEFNGQKWGGFQSCLKYKDSGIFYAEEDAQYFANTFPYVDILLLHAGPRGMLDDPSDPIHTGSENIRRYILEKKPKVVFCGHQYSDDFMDVGETKIFRTYGTRIIEI